MISFVRYRQVKEILESYEYPMPLQEHLKGYFRQNKNSGSRDRKELRQLLYSWMRLGKALKALEFEKRLQLADYLFSEKPVFENSFPEAIGLKDKIAAVKTIYPEFSMLPIFPFRDEISEKLDKEKLLESYAHQPFVWIKVYNEKALEIELTTKNIPFEKHTPSIWKFQPDAKLTDLEGSHKNYFRIQDFSTQSTAGYFHAAPKEKWWDCCAGAGGKSLALLDVQPEVELFASDIRENILVNYKTRLDSYKDRHRNKRFSGPHISQVNLELSTPSTLPQMDGIIADVSCSGSGTWARTPEHLVYFEESKIKDYSRKQLTILNHAWPLLKHGKPLIYITCSVFAEENEKVIEAFCKQNSVKIEEQKYLEGYAIGAENIFLCRMIKMQEEKG